MSEHDKPKDALWLLGASWHRLHHEVEGGHGHRGRTGFARALVLVLGLPLAGPILWAAVTTMPPALAVLAAAFVVFRLVRWYLRR